MLHVTSAAMLAWILALAFPVLLFPMQDGQSGRPNIILVMADDLGWTDLGHMGSRYYETPHIDRLAREGTRIASYYTSPNCAPTRAALMSGQYAPRTGVYSVNTLARGREDERRMIPPQNVTRLPLSVKTLAQSLADAGYATAMYGKWHLGTTGEYHPARRGFQEAIVSDRGHFDFTTDPPVAVEKGTYFADFITDRSVDFIERHRDRPFFLYVAHFAVHSPYQAKQDLIAKYEKKAPAEGHSSAVYAAMIESVDQSVGRILAQLERQGLDERTLVIFTSDNGGLGGYYRTERPSERRGITDNAPLRGGKGTLYEGGIRVPFLARWPGRIRKNATSDEPAAVVDLYPTLLAAARAPSPRGHVLDGVNLMPLLSGERTALERDALYWHFPGYLESYVHKTGWRTPPVGVIRAGRYKLLEFFEDGRTELYDLAEDPGEHRDLAAALPEKARDLRARLASWRKETKADMPVAKP